MPESMESIRVRFTIQLNTSFGQEVRVSGSNDQLGRWDAKKAPSLVYGQGGIWSLELSFSKEEVPFEFKYIITKLEKIKKTVATPQSDKSEAQNVEEVEEFIVRWEQSPNRIVKGNKAVVNLTDKWEKLSMTESEMALEARNKLLEDLNALETFIFPYFVTFPKRMGSREFAIGVFGEPDKTTLRGLAKDKSRSLFMGGILRRTLDNRYQLYWFGRQTFTSNFAGERKYDVTELLPFDNKILTFDDRNAAEISEVTRSDSDDAQDLEGSIQLPPGSIDWPKTFPTVVANLGGDGRHSSDAIQWESATKKWTFIPRALSTRKQRKSEELKPPTLSKPEPVSVRVHSANKNRGTTSFQWIPGTTDIVAFKTTSQGDDSFTYVTVYDRDGRKLMTESYVGPFNYEASILIKDLDCFPTEPFAISTDCETSDLRRREQEMRERIEGAQTKYATLKQQELEEQAAL